MTPATAFPFVYRFTAPAGLKGARCRRLTFDPPVRDHQGKVIMASGDQYVVVEFTDGRRESVSRSAIVSAESKLGRQTLARVARGDVTPNRARRRDRRASVGEAW